MVKPSSSSLVENSDRFFNARSEYQDKKMNTPLTNKTKHPTETEMRITMRLFKKLRCPTDLFEAS
jgi:hypothetical protein